MTPGSASVLSSSPGDTLFRLSSPVVGACPHVIAFLEQFNPCLWIENFDHQPLSLDYLYINELSEFNQQGLVVICILSNDFEIANTRYRIYADQCAIRTQQFIEEEKN